MLLRQPVGAELGKSRVLVMSSLFSILYQLSVLARSGLYFCGVEVNQILMIVINFGVVLNLGYRYQAKFSL